VKQVVDQRELVERQVYSLELRDESLVEALQVFDHPALVKRHASRQQCLAQTWQPFAPYVEVQKKLAMNCLALNEALPAALAEYSRNHVPQLNGKFPPVLLFSGMAALFRATEQLEKALSLLNILTNEIDMREAFYDIARVIDRQVDRLLSTSGDCGNRA
jgi:hypothetical protein